MTDGPLSHIRVLDLTIARAGPMAVRLLADWGADVIKIEPPPRKDAQGNSVTGGRRGPMSRTCIATNAPWPLISNTVKVGRCSIVWLGTPMWLWKIRSSVKYRLGVDYETLKGINPAIVYASISGFGQDGPTVSGREWIRSFRV